MDIPEDRLRYFRGVYGIEMAEIEFDSPLVERALVLRPPFYLRHLIHPLGLGTGGGLTLSMVAAGLPLAVGVTEASQKRALLFQTEGPQDSRVTFQYYRSAKSFGIGVRVTPSQFYGDRTLVSRVDLPGHTLVLQLDVHPLYTLNDSCWLGDSRLIFDATKDSMPSTGLSPLTFGLQDLQEDVTAMPPEYESCQRRVTRFVDRDLIDNCKKILAGAKRGYRLWFRRLDETFVFGGKSSGLTESRNGETALDTRALEVSRISSGQCSRATQPAQQAAPAVRGSRCSPRLLSGGVERWADQDVHSSG